MRHLIAFADQRHKPARSFHDVASLPSVRTLSSGKVGR
jgi:hypothetical protein